MFKIPILLGAQKALLTFILVLCVSTALCGLFLVGLSSRFLL